MENKMKLGESYKDFTVESCKYSEAAKSTIIRLKHKTGLEVVHFLNDCQDNMVFFGFRTAEPTARGTPHIMEHTVLCGSEKYKVKDPFISMANQSMNTFLNAFTYADFTGYPVSSMNKKDFFNLASVYADATFFPMLDKGAFMQEGHRCEVDENGKVSIQGVVYNEMKGAYSSPVNVVYTKIDENLLPGTIYAKDSGGDPAEIPNLTYEDFVAFHKKWYRLSNCLAAFYGNIPTKELLDFLEKEIISRRANEENVDVFPEYDEYTKQKEKLNNKIVETEIPVASSSEDSKTFTIAWNLGEPKTLKDHIENVMISNVLGAHTGSYVLKAIVDSGLGVIGQISGLLSEERYDVLTYSIDNFTGKTEDARKIIVDAIRSVVENGIDETVRDSVVNIEKYGLLRTDQQCEGLMKLVSYMHMWTYKRDVDSYADLKKEIDALCEKALEKGYLENLIKERLLDNADNVSMTFDLSSRNVEAFAKKEQENIDKILETTSIDNIKEEYKIMEKFQNTFTDTSSLPRISVSDLAKGEDVVEKNNVTIEYINAHNNKGIPLFYSEANKPGTVDINVSFPVDKISPSDYKYLKLLAYVLSDIGYDDVAWSDANTLMTKYTGYFYNCLDFHPLRENDRTLRIHEKHKDFSCRDFIVYNVSCLIENLDKTLEILERTIQNPNFGDEKRIKNLIDTYVSDLNNDFCPDGRQYVRSRVNALSSVIDAKQEIVEGLTAYKFLNNLRDVNKTTDKLKSLFETIKDSGSMVFYTCSGENSELIKSKLERFVKRADLKELSSRPHTKDEDFYKEVFKGGKSQKEHLVVDTNTGYAALNFKGSKYMEKDSFAEDTLLQWMNTNALWTQLRTVHGCYGAYVVPNHVSGICEFATYRDPNPSTSNSEFLQCAKETANKEFTQDDVEKMVISSYGDKTQPKTISGKALYFYHRTIESLDDQDRIDTINEILALTPTDINNVAKKIDTMAHQPDISEAVFCKSVSEDFKPNVIIDC